MGEAGRCPRNCCWTPYGCAKKRQCDHHREAVQRDAIARREKAARAALRGLRDPDWTGEPRT